MLAKVRQEESHFFMDGNGGDADLQNEIKTQLDTFNNMKVGEGNGVKYIPSNPAGCPAIPNSFMKRYSDSA